MIERRPVSSAGTQVTVPQTPNLLAVYCDTLDSTGHREGPSSPEIDAGLAMTAPSVVSSSKSWQPEA